ncbi:yippee zinc-binding/DNA-binding /Mis18, centromere assembly-domain-containing protein [Helicostylum pulchrum]|nr:yippee zinc-binding/DNA-binding /Mis18, centromere assembly-domain-containing protein [Helicostylum pulchrum]
MGFSYRTYLESSSSIYGCAKCNTHLTTAELVISKQFQGRHGQAFLLETVVNIDLGKAEDREMTTGLHRVKEISCIKCSMMLGWTYVKAYSDENKYKEGKFILEKKLLVDLTPKVQVVEREIM